MLLFQTFICILFHLLSTRKENKQKKEKNSMYCTVWRKLFHLQTLWVLVRSNTESERELKTVIPMNESLSEAERERKRDR